LIGLGLPVVSITIFAPFPFVIDLIDSSILLVEAFIVLSAPVIVDNFKRFSIKSVPMTG